MVAAALLGLLLPGCSGLTPREQRVQSFESSPIARVISISGIVLRRCVVSDEALVDQEVRLKVADTDSVLARVRTGADGSFTLRVPRSIDARYSLHVLELSTDVPDSSLINYSARLSVPCDSNDAAGLVARFVGPEGVISPHVDLDSAANHPDGTESQLQSPSERMRLQTSGN